MLFGEAVMINWSDVAVEHRHAYYEWHSREHMVGRVAIPGFRRGRRYIAARASRDFLVCYEVENIGVPTSEAYMMKANAPSPLTQRTTPFVKNASRGLARVRASFGIGMGGAALTLRFDPDGARAESLEAWLTTEALPALSNIAEITGAHFMIADREASAVVPVERQGRPTTVPNRIVLVEGVSVAALEELCEAYLNDAALRRNGAGADIVRDTYTLQITVSAEP
ncbi:MAG TPA: hypothetical protein VHP37_24870 [Burkholderiales bacterium]|nr:hypothetical protein [Burkholderiales bacterium]